MAHLRTTFLRDLLPHHWEIGSQYFECNYSLLSSFQNPQIKERRLITHLKKYFSVQSNCFLLLNIRITTSFIRRDITQKFQTNQQLLYQSFHGNSPRPGS